MTGTPRRDTGGDRQGGQATVELALLLPLVALLLLVVLHVGLVARDVLLVAHAAREAARAAATDPSPGAARAAAVESSGLDPARLEVVVTGRGAPGSRVRVEISYRAAPDLPILGGVVGGRVVRASATMRVEHPVHRLASGGGPLESSHNGHLAEDFSVFAPLRGRIWQSRKRR